MCCWDYKDVYLEDPPAKKPEEDKNEYIMVSSAMETPKAPHRPYLGIMAYYQWTPPEEASQPAAPENGWERLRKAQDEARRNAQPPPLHPAPASAAPVPVQYSWVPFATPVPAPEPEKAYYYTIVQPAYIPQPAMSAQPIYPVAHQMFYQAPEPAKPAEPEKPNFGDPNQEFYCREFNGSWSLRTLSAIMKECQPGFWQTSQSGYPVFYRQKA